MDDRRPPNGDEKHAQREVPSLHGLIPSLRQGDHLLAHCPWLTGAFALKLRIMTLRQILPAGGIVCSGVSANPARLSSTFPFSVNWYQRGFRSAMPSEPGSPEIVERNGFAVGGGGIA